MTETLDLLAVRVLSSMRPPSLAWDGAEPKAPVREGPRRPPGRPKSTRASRYGCLPAEEGGDDRRGCHQRARPCLHTPEDLQLLVERTSCFLVRDLVLLPSLFGHCRGKVVSS